MDSSHFDNLQNKGYSVIRNHIDSDDIAEWKNMWSTIEKIALYEKQGLKHYDIPGMVDMFFEGKPYVWKGQNILRRTKKGMETSKKYEEILQKNIHPNIRFIKDRFMNQKKDYQGHLPHQDTGSGHHKKITDSWYTVYTSLTDTDENSGCLWVEDITPKRSSGIGYCDDGCASGQDCKCISIKVTPVEMKTYRGHNMIPIDLKSGDSIIFDGWLLHGTAANLSNTNRQTLMFTYGILRDNDLEIKDIYHYYNN